MDAKFLDQFKENIQPLPNGRPALKVGAALKESRDKELLRVKRNEYEARLAADDSDDPLQDFVDYIAWIQAHYPLGESRESGLLRVLEQCTLCFRDTPYYRDDPRYLKVWLAYATFSPLLKDIFVYMAKKSIGMHLALYYEEFAKYLELHGQLADAREVYEVGIERESRPLARLRRSFQAFQYRTAHKPTLDTSHIRQNVLSHSVPASAVVPPATLKRQKIAVCADERPLAFKEIVFEQSRSPKFALILDRSHENAVPVSAWNGATVKQRACPDLARVQKFEVFRDNDTPKEELTYEPLVDNGETFTIVKQPGKPSEKLCINLDLFYGAEEMCLAEVLAQFATKTDVKTHKGLCADPLLPANSGMSVSKALQPVSTVLQTLSNETQTASKNVEPAPKSALFVRKTDFTSNRVSAGQITPTQERYVEQNHTLTIPLRDEDTTKRPDSPTVTMVTRATANEVLRMFNEAAQNIPLEDELFRTFEESTNYDGFVTETIERKPQGTDRDTDCTKATPLHYSASNPKTSHYSTILRGAAHSRRNTGPTGSAYTDPSSTGRNGTPRLSALNAYEEAPSSPFLDQP